MDPIAEIVSAQLKEMFNSGFVYIEQKKFKKASECFENTLTLCKMVKYEHGTRMAYISLANLHALEGDVVSSFKMSAMAYDGCEDENINAQAKRLIQKTIGPAMQYGILSQKNGKAAEALEIYKLAQLFLKGPKKAAVENEIRKMEAQIDS